MTTDLKPGIAVWCAFGRLRGRVISISWHRRCNVEDCNMPQAGIRWEDGGLTWVCEGSLYPWRKGLRVGCPELWRDMKKTGA